jgi:chemotaxis protein CheX
MSTALTEESLNLYKGCIRQAAADVLSTVCGVSIQPQDDDSSIASQKVIIGVISLVGDAEMSVFIGLPSGTAPGLVAKFAGFEVPYESPDMGDAVGELSNMLAGGMKNLLDAKNVKVNISLPTVVRAEDIQILLQHGAQSVKISFGSDLGPLWVGIAAGQGGRFVA